MAYSFIKNKKGGVSVLLDSAADISLVPVDQFFPGTFAFTADGSAHYRLSTSRTWVEAAGSGVTPGGGWPEDLPLPSEGGYGYSEGESVAIEWDGSEDDERFITPVGLFVPNIVFSDPNDFVGCSITLHDWERDREVSFSVTQENISEHVELFSEVPPDVVMFVLLGVHEPSQQEATSVLMSVANDTEISGVQLAKGFYLYPARSTYWYVEKFSLEYENVHHIDSKYLPQSPESPEFVPIDDDGTVDYDMVAALLDSGKIPYYHLTSDDYGYTLFYPSGHKRSGNNPYVRFTAIKPIVYGTGRTSPNQCTILTFTIGKPGGWTELESLTLYEPMPELDGTQYPHTDGEYALKCTVTDGVPVLTWETST